MKKLIVILLIACMTFAGAALSENTGLPAYVYPGDDPIEAAVTACIVEKGKDYLLEDGAVTIPAPVILKTVFQDDTHTLVYGNFWVLNYVEKDHVLECISGGEYPGVMTLEKKDDCWEAVALEIAGDGDDYPKDIRRFADGDAELENAYFHTQDVSEEPLKGVRTRFIQDYVNANGLDITAYQDYGWDAIPLTDTIVGRIEDGSYILRFPVQENETGEWVADDMAQNDSIVKLAYARLENGAFEVRYDPVGDGEMAVAVRHMNGIACDEAHTFELLVKDGKIQEVTGGSYTASPTDEELAAYCIGEWREQETQFTQMTIGTNDEGALTAEIVSPMTHGAYLFRMTLHYDCELNAFLYDDGALYDLPITDSEEADLGEPVQQNLSGRLLLLADENDTLLLSWYNQLTPEEPEIVFFRLNGEEADK